MSSWSKGKAAAMKRFMSSETWESFLADAKAGQPKIKEAKTLEEAALLGARKEGREEILQEMADACEWEDADQDAGNSHQSL